MAAAAAAAIMADILSLGRVPRPRGFRVPLTDPKVAFLLHSSEENDDMSVLVAVIHFRVGLKLTWWPFAIGANF